MNSSGLLRCGCDVFSIWPSRRVTSEASQAETHQAQAQTFRRIGHGTGVSSTKWRCC